MRRVRQLAPALLALCVGCSGAVDAAATEAETPAAPAPAPTIVPAPPPPELAPVAGERLPGAHWVDSSGLLRASADPVAPPDTVLPAVHAVGDWLDAHLDDLQRGGPGRLEDVAAAELLADATAADVAAVTTALASPSAPVAGAVYRLDAAYHDTTEWVTATVEVTSTAGAAATATLVFVPASHGLELVLFGAADGTSS